MPADVQATPLETFRGMEKAFIIPFILSGDGQNVADDSSEGAKEFNLDRILSRGEISSENSRRVLELSLPNGTNAMLFYAKAIKDGTDAAEGKIEYTVGKDPSSITFKLAHRLSTDKEAAFAQEIALLEFIETYLIRSSLDYNVSFGDQTATGTRSWKYYADKKALGQDVSPLGEILASAFSSYTTIESGELRAGSGNALAKTNGDLWAVIHNVVTSTPTSLEEAIAKTVASEVASRLSKFFTEEGDNCKWKDMSSIKSNLTSISDVPSVSLIESNDLNTFPSDFNLAEGCAQLSYIGDPGGEVGDVDNIYISYKNVIDITHLSSGNTDVKNLMFPAELTYFRNSPVRVSNTEHSTAEYPNGVSNWNNNSAWSSDWVADSHVTSSTRSVAMKNDINYGTALLETTVRYGAAVLKDNRVAMTGDNTDNDIPANDGTFILKGILIGGQPSHLGWDFTRKYRTSDAATAAGAEGAENFNNVIYDTEIANSAIPAYSASAAKSDPNYTLVFDNWDSSLGDGQSDVFVALEFENRSGMDFWGKHNLIRNTCTFYIVGKLDHTQGGDITWPEYHALPPYNPDGSTIQNKRIFIQDYMTKADFVLGENSLKNAYVGIPDLRSSHISLGLSVDINWMTGLNFSEVVLGNY